MLKKFSYLIYKFVIILDLLLNKIFNKNIKYYIYDYLRSSNFTRVKHKNSTYVNFFVPSSVTKSRVDNFFNKEPDTLKWIDSFKKNENEKIIFWDIGSNIGTFSIYAAFSHKNIEIHSFEPSPGNLVVLSKNISLNNLKEKILINQFPLTKKISENKYLLMKEKKFIEGGAQNSFGEDYDFKGEYFKSKTEYKILGTSIDFLVNNKILELPDYIKLDVDGIEHVILSGGINTIKNKKIKSILIEINENFKDQFENCKNILTEADFIFKEKNIASSKREKSENNFMYNYIFEKKI